MVEVYTCNWSATGDCEAVASLMNHYMQDKMGDAQPHSKDLQKKMIEDLSKHPSNFVLLARYKEEIIGLANCYVNYGTFLAKPFVNIHDIVVLNTFRGIGAGEALMQGITDKASELGCGKITLEVREDNLVAQKLYRKMGYDECVPVMRFWTKKL